MAGSLSGLASALASYPLEVLRTRVSVGGSLRDAVRHGSLMAGCSLTLLETVPYSALTLGTYGYLSKSGSVDKVSAGLVAGAVGTTACFPVDTVRRNKIMLPGKSVFEIVELLLDEGGGIRRLYRGMSVALVKAAPTVAITMSLNDLLLEYLIHS